LRHHLHLTVSVSNHTLKIRWPDSLCHYIMPIFMIVLFVAMFYFCRRGASRPMCRKDSNGASSDSKNSETAIDVLKKRYAKGDITREEFEQVKKDLQS
ncbi:SHOCT domain-containing protein, partial [Halomonas sp. RA08-2]|uniref:SHOCT domain-containing protein n=1 Tax=Halomonas sp. RA08-2 TaxID=3440842 RepID=UPI003EED73D9